MSKTISYRGPAAGAFVRAQQSEKLKTEEEKLERVATIVYGQVATGTVAGMKVATYVLSQLLKDGLDEVSKRIVNDTKLEDPKRKRARHG
jgi:hypothetical protein